MPNDQVEIKFGPARFDSPKAIRRAIEDTATQTEENTINNITNNPNISLGGGASFEEATISTFVPNTNTGTATLTAGGNIDYTNGLTTYLTAGDTVLVTQLADGTWVVTAILDRSGAFTPVDQPVAYLSPNFPLRTDTLAFVIGRTSSDSSWFTDSYGALGLGLDTIVGAFGTTGVNAFSRQTSSNTALYPTPTAATYQMYMQPNGRVIATVSGSSSVYYRAPGAGSWTLYTIPTATQYVHTFDTSTGAFWVVTVAASNVVAFYRLLPGDSAFVSAGTLGTTVTSGNTTYLAADNGYLVMHSVDPALTTNRKVFTKLSDDASSFTQTGVYVATQFTPTAAEVDMSGRMVVVVSSSPTQTWHIRRVAQNGAIADFDTGITIVNTAARTWHCNTSGLIIMSFMMRADTIGLPGTTLFYPVIAAYAEGNVSPTTYVYVATDCPGASIVSSYISWLEETEPGKTRFQTNTANPSFRTYFYELTGL